MAIKHHASKKALFDIKPPPQLFPTTLIHSYSYKKLTDSTDSTDSMHSDILARQRKNKY